MMAEMSGTKTTELISVEPLVAKDRISELPWEIVDNILGRLPIKNAVATTILSRKWKNKWVDVSKIVLDDYSNEAGIIDSKLFTRLVYHVLLSHRGTIGEFTFVSHGSESFGLDVDHWICFLSKCDIKELSFHFSSTHESISSLFSHCKQSRNLSLTNCCFLLPENVPLFRTLVSLHLTLCSYEDEDLEKMINSSPNLEKLVLENTNFKRLTICAPNLRYLSLEGDFKGVYLETCPLLTDVSLKMTAEVEEISDDLIQPPHWLSRIRRLVMSGFFLKFLAKRYNWHGASIDYPNLEVLELETIHFYSVSAMEIAFSILRSSSNLSILLLNGLEDYDKFANYYLAEAHNQEKGCFKKLRHVRITILRTGVLYDWAYGTRIEIESMSQVYYITEMIRILLDGSPVLENMHIHYIYLETDDIWFMRKLLSYERASSQLKLTYTSTQGHHFTYYTNPEPVLDCWG